MVFVKKSWIAAAVFTIIGLIAGLVLSSNFNVHSKGYSGESAVSREAVETLSKTNEAMSEVVAAVKPAVVNISSTKTIKGSGVPSPFFQDPLFRRFFGDEFGPQGKPREHKQSGLGSGVIVDRNGYILTNNHVVRGADEIKVILSDKREFKGRVIGSDPKTDLAVVKIDSNGLPVITLGDSEALKVGETVLAIGNAFGLSHTVTMGIVSAVGRANVGIADYEDFIQTDAPINPGNSGGALVNVRGELVGINTAIFSTTGGYQGIGFAIPSNMARDVMESLIKHGKVVRGWLGVTIQPLTPDLAKQFNLKDDKGVLVGDIVDDSPADRAGIQRGDIIAAYDGKDVTDVAGLRNMVAGTPPQKETAIKLIRNGKAETVTVKITELPAEPQILARTFQNQLQGVSVQNITPAMKKQIDIPERVQGVLITDIDDDSPSEGVLKKEDVIMEVNKKPIKNTKDFEEVASKSKPADDMLVLIFRQKSTFYVTLPGK